MKQMLIRLLSGSCGVIAAFIAIGTPLLFIANTMQEMEAARQYDGHPSLAGAIGGSILILAVTVLFGIGAYKLIRRALTCRIG